MAITTELIKELRDATGVSGMQCKKALEEAGGDIEKAKIILRKISKQSADKKASRTLGLSYGYLCSQYWFGGTMVELLCETDFVARNEDFKALAKDIAMHITALAPEYLKMEDIKEEDKTKAKELFEEGVDKNKPQEMRDKIIEGKLNAYFSEKYCLNRHLLKSRIKN